MTPAASQQFYDAFPDDVARGILEGRRLRAHAARVSLVREAGSTGFAIDTLQADGRPKEWERTTQRICKILKNEVERLPAKTKTPLAAVAHLMSEDTPVPLITLETWLSMKDDGGSWWEVTALLNLAAVCLPDVVKASERAKKRVLRVVTQL
ncbi:hypothetical protein [Methanoculleus sp.]|uniref:hypothetical protein n=1 Tax=Methanoculleus sp. TaxID=90427 RepID=UPI001BD38F54|nr:hypothetical protein [Methanoculleus sp.]